jgi:hypothetical protein
MGDPAETRVPTLTEVSTGSYVVRNEPCVTVTTPRPAMVPAKLTTPPLAALTSCPTEAARSTPRCPAPQGVPGGSNLRRT